MGHLLKLQNNLKYCLKVFLGGVSNGVAAPDRLTSAGNLFLFFKEKYNLELALDVLRRRKRFDLDRRVHVLERASGFYVGE